MTVAKAAMLALGFVAWWQPAGLKNPAFAAEVELAQGRAAPGLSPEAQRSRFEAAMGGAYNDPVVRRYIVSIGDRLAAKLDLSNEYGVPLVNFAYSVLDNPAVGAFVLPPGNIYVTRGLLAVASGEAEVAAAIAHEMAHVALGHTQGVGADPAVSRDPSNPFNRDKEVQADLLSLAILARSGYDPVAQARMLTKVAQDIELTGYLTVLQGRSGAARDAAQRVVAERLEQIRAALASPGPMLAAGYQEDRHLVVVDGLIYGDLPYNGMVRGRTFYDTAMRMSFEAPVDYAIAAGRVGIFAAGPGGATMDVERRELRIPPGTMLDDYLRRVVAHDTKFDSVERTFVNDMEAAVGEATTIDRQGKEFRLLIAVLKFSPRLLLRVRYVTPLASWAAMEPEVTRSLASFRALSVQEAQSVRPLRLQVVKVGPGETVQSLAERMALADLQVERFLALNGLPVTARLAPGQLVKLIGD